MSLIILLILSEDETFNKRIHEIVSIVVFFIIVMIKITINNYIILPKMLKGVTWYTERSISEISLGGLLILVVIRTIQYNMFKMRVSILHPLYFLLYIDLKLYIYKLESFFFIIIRINIFIQTV